MRISSAVRPDLTRYRPATVLPPYVMELEGITPPWVSQYPRQWRRIAQGGGLRKGLEVAETKTRIVHLQPEVPGIDFLGFHHRIVQSFRYPGRHFLAQWPSHRAMSTARARIRELTDQRWLFRPVSEVIQAVNRFLRGWGGYFRRGNSTRHFHAMDAYVLERMSRFLTKKHGRAGQRYGGYLLGRSRNQMRLCCLVGTVGRGRIVHAV